jgi:hypothetical protein
MSAFALEDGVVHHTYSAYERGLDVLWGMYQWLDRAPLGRNEAGLWWRATTSTTASETASLAPSNPLVYCHSTSFSCLLQRLYVLLWAVKFSPMSAVRARTRFTPAWSWKRSATVQSR